MKTFALLISLVATVDAFTVAPSTVPVRSTAVLRESATAEVETKKDAELAGIYEQIGITKDEMAMGINPDEVLKYIGTRAEMVEKAMGDISKFDRDRAELEVGKYLLDPEAVNYHIEFKKRLEENPMMLADVKEESPFSKIVNFQNIVAVYFAYIVGEIIYKSTPLHDKVDLDWVPGWGPPAAKVAGEAADTFADAMAATSDAAASVSTEAASSVAEAVSNSI